MKSTEYVLVTIEFWKLREHNSHLIISMCNSFMKISYDMMTYVNEYLRNVKLAHN